MSSLSSVTINALEDIRTVTQKLLDEQKLSAQQTVQVFTQELPARVIAYQYYGSSELGESIAELNGEINVSNMVGNITILTS